MATLQAGTPLCGGAYTIIKLLASGGFADVYLAEQRWITRPVAIKVLKSDISDDTKMLGLFQRAARATGSVRHPNVLTVCEFTFDVPTNVWFLAMEYIPGGETLRQRMGQPIDLKETARVVSVMASALDAAHALGIVHRDLKPENILMDGDRPLLADFGIAALKGFSAAGFTGKEFGTAAYMDPERWRQVEANPSSDQYSLAVIAYELLAGRLPFLGDGLEIMGQHLNASPPPLQDLNPRVAQGIDTVIRKGLSKLSAGRYATCSDFARALGNAIDDTTKLPARASFDAASSTDREVHHRVCRTSAAWDPDRSQMHIYLGTHSLDDESCVLSYSPNSNAWVVFDWAHLSRDGTSSVWDPIKGRMLVFGGRTTFEFEELEFSTLYGYYPTDEFFLSLRSEPDARYEHSAIWDAVSKRMLVFGGNAQRNCTLSDLWAYDPAGLSWTEIRSSGGPAARAAHTAVWDSANDQMLIFGGTTADNNNSNDLWSYRPATDTWMRLDPDNKPGPRCWHTAVWDSVNAQMLIFGGFHYNPSSASYLGDLWSYRPSDNSWSESTPEGGPAARHSHVAIWDPTDELMLLCGGQGEHPPRTMDDLGGYRPATNTWTQLHSLTMSHFRVASADSVGP